MFSFVNSIPIAGHLKGLVHYAKGETEEGDKAMKESTRSSVVMGAGAVGCVAGPVGAAAMGAATGALWDSVETVATGQATGFVKGIENIAETASKGEVPVKEILLTTVTVTGDVIGGLGGGSLAATVSNATGQVAANTIGKSVGRSAGENILKSASVPAGETFGKAVAQSVGKSVGKSVGESVTKTAVKEAAKRVIIEEVTNAAIDVCAVTKKAANVLHDKIEEAQQGSGGSGSGSSSIKTSCPSFETVPSSTTTGSSTSGTGGASSGTGTGGSGQKPPGKNPKQTTCSQQTPESYMQEFLTAFGVQSLDQISIRGQYIFRNLINSQKKYLKKMLKALRDRGVSLKRMITTIVNIFNTVKLEDVTFVNFLSFLEFILQYLAERMARCNELGSRNDVFPEIAGRLFLPHDYTIVDVFQQIRTQIESRSLLINFRDIFAAVYHYFKHRIVGAHELTVTQYYDLTQGNLHIIINTQEYRDLLRNGQPSIRFERYYARYGRRLVIGISAEGNRGVLSTCYFLDDSYEGDSDGDMYINNRRLP